MKTYLLLFIVSACSALVLTPLVRHISRRFGLLDEPLDDRRVHRIAVPRLGGVAIFAAILLALSALLFGDNLVTQSLRAGSLELLTVLAPATIVFLIGIYDDFRGTNAPTKFTGQIVAAMLFWLLGGRIEVLSVPLVGSIELHPVIGCALTLLWTVGISNAFNLIDGLDGLATGASLFAALVMLMVSLTLGNPLITVMAIVLCGSLIGFLPYNFNPASIFLGDSGSLFIGFTLAALAVQGTQKASTAVAVAIPLTFGLPLVDTSFSIFRRFIGGRPLFQGDREHIHHMLLARGWSQRHVTLLLYSACALFGLSALLLANAAVTRTTGFVLFVVSAAIPFSVGRIRYHEIDEVKAGVRRMFCDHRLRIANNVRLRRATHMMSNASRLSEIYSAVEGLLEVGEFVYATMYFGRSENGNKVDSLHEKPVTAGETENSGDSIYQCWNLVDIDSEELNSGRFWTIRLPLSTRKTRYGYFNLYREFGDEALLLDINYLCDLFQRETAKALERVLMREDQQEKTLKLVVTPPAHAAAKELVLVTAGADYAEASPLRVAV